MSRRWKKRNCPSGKVRYRSEDHASTALSEIRAARQFHDADPERVESRYYYCRRCNGWHLTSRPEFDLP